MSAFGRSLPDNQEFAQSFPPAARTATANGAGVQSGADADARAVLLDLGLWTDGTHKFTVERSELGSIWIEMTAEELDDPAGALDPVDLNSVNIVDATNDNQVVQLGALTTDEHLRVVTTVSGGPGTGLVAGATIQAGHPLRAAGSTNPVKPDGIVFSTGI